MARSFCVLAVIVCLVGAAAAVVAARPQDQFEEAAQFNADRIQLILAGVPAPPPMPYRSQWNQLLLAAAAGSVLTAILFGSLYAVIGRLQRLQDLLHSRAPTPDAPKPQPQPAFVAEAIRKAAADDARRATRESGPPPLRP